MAHDDNNGMGEIMFWILMGLLGLIVAADLTGRLVRVILYEWSFISWGLAMLASTAITIWNFHSFDKAQRAHASSVKQELDRWRFKLEVADNHVKQLEKRIDETRHHIHEYYGECRILIRKLAEAAERKTPILVSAPKSPEAVQNAVNEITGSES